MKLTVCFGDTKVVVPCGSGDLSIRDLAFSSLKRVRHTLPKLGPHDRVVVHSVTIARDGGILDWDDLVRDVLDDRELVTAHYSIATLAAENTPASCSTAIATDAPTEHTSDPTFPQLCSPLVVDLCSDSGAGGSTPSGPQSTDASGSGEGRATVVLLTAGPADLLGPEGLAVDGSANASASSSSLSLNMSSGSCSAPGHQLHCPSNSVAWQSSAGGHPLVTTTGTASSDSAQTIRELVSRYGSSEDAHGTIKRAPTFTAPDAPRLNGDVNRPGHHPSQPRPGSAIAFDAEQLPAHAESVQCTNTFPKLWQKAFPPTPFELLPTILSRRRDCLAMNWDSDEEEDEDDDVDVDFDFDDAYDPSRPCPRHNHLESVGLKPQSPRRTLPPVTTAAVSGKPSDRPDPSSQRCDFEANSAQVRVYQDPVPISSPDIWPLPPPPAQFDDSQVTIPNQTASSPSSASTDPAAKRQPACLSASAAHSVNHVGAHHATMSKSKTPMLFQTCLIHTSLASTCECSEVSLLTTTTASSSTSANGGGSVSSSPTSHSITVGNAAGGPSTPDSVSDRAQSAGATDNVATTTGVLKAVSTKDSACAQIPSVSDPLSFSNTMSPTPLLQPVPVPPIRLNVNRFGSLTFACVPPVPPIPEVEEYDEDAADADDSIEEEEEQGGESDDGDDESNNGDREEKTCTLKSDDAGVTGTAKRSPKKTKSSRPTNDKGGKYQATSESGPITGQRRGPKQSVVDVEEETEEDYPLLRPDYFVGHERTDNCTVTTRTSGKNHIQRQSSFEQLRDADEPGSATRRDFHVAVEEYDGSGTLRNPMAVHVGSTGGAGMVSPAVLRWLESTQAAASMAGSGLGSTSGSASSTSITATNQKPLDSASGSTLSNPSKRTVHEDGTTQVTVDAGSGQDSGALRMPGTVLVRLTNRTPGENLGIQIKPVFTDRADLLAQGYQVPIGQRIESGLEVHHIMPNGRVAREGFLSVGDRIMSIDSVSLIGVPFERGRDLFQAALKKPELSFHVLRKSARVSNGATGETNKVKSELPSCRLIVVPDFSEKAREAESTAPGRGGSTTRPAAPPPPPPRRSPHTVLTRIPAGIIPPLIQEFFQDAAAHSHANAQITSTAPPVSSPAPDSTSRVPTTTAGQPALSNCISIQLKKGSNGLGFSLTSRDLTPNQSGLSTTERVVCVKNILPGGAALLDGRLRSGDRLIKVDGLDVTKLGQANTVALLREKPVNSVIDLLVWRAQDPELGQTTDKSTIAGCRKPNERAPTQTSSRAVSTSATATAAVEVQETDEVEHKATVSSSAPADESKSAAASKPPSPAHLPASQMYKHYAIDPAHYTLLQLHISLPQVTPPPPQPAAVAMNESPTGTGSDAVAASPEVSGSGSTAHPVTLGVSVSVRPLANQPIITSNTQDTSSNAVFVRTVIEGGPAHQDGRLKIGDRLLTIDGEPLSGLSSADALNKLKMVIARDMAESRPHVCLLIARSRTTAPAPAPSQPQPTVTTSSVNPNETETGTAKLPPPSTASTEPANRVSTRSHAPGVTRDSAGPTDRVGANLPSTSMVVSADVHPAEEATGSTRSDTQPARKKSEPRRADKCSQESRIPNKTATAAAATAVKTLTAKRTQSKPSSATGAGDHLVNGSSSGSKKAIATGSRTRTAVKSSACGLSAVSPRSRQRNNSSEQTDRTTNLVVAPPARVTQPPELQRQPIVASSAGVHSNRQRSSPVKPPVEHTDSAGLNGGTAVSDRVYRCDSQGTISSTEMPEDEARLSDPNTATDRIVVTDHARASSASSTSSTDLVELQEETAVLSDPETERYSSLNRHPHHRRRRGGGSARNGGALETKTMRFSTKYESVQPAPCRVVFRQPVIDLSQMVLVPFDADSWAGPVLKPRSALTEAEQAQLVDDTHAGGLSSSTSPRVKHRDMDELLARNRRLFSRKTSTTTTTRKRFDSASSSSGPTVTQFGTNLGTGMSRIADGPARGLTFHYDSDSGASHQSDSLTSEAGHSNQSLKKRTVMSKLFGLVKTGTQRRSTHPNLTDNATGERPSESLHQASSITTNTTITISKVDEGVTRPVGAASRLCPSGPVENNPKNNNNRNGAKRSDRASGTDRMPCATTLSNRVRETGPRIQSRLADYCTLNSRPSATHHVYHLARADHPPVDISTSTTDTQPRSPIKQCGTTSCSTPVFSEADRVCSKPRTQPYADLAFVVESAMSGHIGDRLAALRAQIPRLTTETVADVEVPVSKSTINRLYDNDASSCSTAYESVVEFLTATEGSTSPKQKSGREVYEDAEALYRYLADLKQPVGSGDEDDNGTPEAVCPQRERDRP